MYPETMVDNHMSINDGTVVLVNMQIHLNGHTYIPIVADKMKYQLLPSPCAGKLRHHPDSRGLPQGLALVPSLRRVLCHLPQALKLPVTLN